jgi:hypothetical protein
MLRSFVRLCALVSSVCIVGGCISMGLHQTARTAPPGKFEFGGALTPFFIALDPSGASFLTFPYPELHARVGLSRNLDIGARWSLGPGLGVDGKYRFASGPVDAAFRLGASLFGFYTAGVGAGIYSLEPSFIVSRESQSGLPWELDLGLTYLGVFAGSDGEGTSGGSLSLNAGAGLPFRALNALRIMPEVGALIPLAGSSDGEITVFPAEGVLIRMGVSVGSVARGEEE